MTETTKGNAEYDRAAWMTLLAEAPVQELEAHWGQVAHPTFAWIRRPESGSAMVRGRASGTGMQFNLGDVTVTKCTLQLRTGEIGVSYVMGRNKRHAALAALFDAMLQNEGKSGEPATQAFIAALDQSRTRRHQAIVAETKTSKVDFTMLARGDVEL
ncbi:phosphonate C-P lyase system protein PhnG [Rhizobium laguerreae]|uniref:phosphonate C-P lyase system protein PhnG n=1 Tax=Rhizobium laguerreae TaxID=1076926 RepID=UPI001FE05B14|nr:phosphonate C-P lyase system protein PhnG [Rhizobium laguerreae]